MTILIDTSEPADIELLLSQAVPTARMPLNQTDRSDYYFGGEDGKTRQFSRKQAGELLGDLDEAEKQIRDYYNNADENYQIVEGLISSVPMTRRNKSLDAISIRRQSHPTHMFSYKVADNGFIHHEQVWNISAAMFYAWLFQLDQAGVTTYFTENSVATARLLAAIYKSCQKPPENHSTLQRYIRPRIVIKEHDPFVKALMSLSLAYQIGIGEDKATKIATKYHSILDIAMSEVDELREIEGIGKTIAEKLLSALGREL